MKIADKGGCLGDLGLVGKVVEQFKLGNTPKGSYNGKKVNKFPPASIL
jgi:hypothetical protein